MSRAGIHRRGRRDEARFRGLLESAPDAMVIVDERGRIELVNARTEEMFGYPREELIGQPVEVLVPTAARERHQGMQRTFLAAPRPRPMGAGRDLAARRRDGSEFPVEISLSPLRTDDGLLVSAAVRDITARRVLERALAASEELFRTTFEHAPIGMAIVSPAGRWLRVNRALCEILAIDAAAVLARGYEDAIEPEDLEADRVTRERLLAGELDAHQLERPARQPSGAVVWTEWSIALLRDEHGEPSHFVVQVRDITAERATRAREAAAREQLRHMADHDPLTGLMNRRGLEAVLRSHLAHCRRYGPAGALLVLDLDGFKLVNDSLGHAAGDALIRACAGALSARLRETDTIARLGGDEFAILLPDPSGARAEHVAAELLAVIRERASALAARPAASLSASIGIAPFGPGQISAEEMLAEADLAMYEAKRAGKDRFAVHQRARPDGRRTVAPARRPPAAAVADRRPDP